MPVLVLVRGSFHGVWCWQRVVPLLGAAGHAVYKLMLTGLGERVHLGFPDVGLDTHIQDIVNVLELRNFEALCWSCTVPAAG